MPDNTHGRQYDQPDQVRRLLWIIAGLVEKNQQLEAENEKLLQRELHRKQAGQG